MIAYDDCKHHSQCVRLLKPTFGRQLDTWRIITALFVPGGVHDMTDQWWDVQAYESTTDVLYFTLVLLYSSILLHTVLHTWTTLPTTYLTLPYFTLPYLTLHHQAAGDAASMIVPSH